MDLDVALDDEIVELLTKEEIDDEEEDVLLQMLWDAVDNATEGMAKCVAPLMQDMMGTLSGDVSITSLEDGGLFLEPDRKHGHVYIEFDEEAYYGCRDLNKFEDHQEQVNFEIILNGWNKLVLKFPEPIGRDTVEEF